MRLTFVVALGAALVAAAGATADEGPVPTRDCRTRIESGNGPLQFGTPTRLSSGLPR
jgi:hypothetical protein